MKTNTSLSELVRENLKENPGIIKLNLPDDANDDFLLAVLDKAMTRERTPLDIFKDEGFYFEYIEEHADYKFVFTMEDENLNGFYVKSTSEKETYLGILNLKDLSNITFFESDEVTTDIREARVLFEKYIKS